MKKVFLPFLLMGIVYSGFGQSLKKVEKYLDDKNIEKAKTELDAYLAKKGEDTEALYLKSKIYSTIADSAALHGLVTGDARAEAFEAFKKAYADSANVKLKMQILKDNYQPVFNMYSGYYADAAAAFNDGAANQDKARFADAMNLFLKSNDIGQYLAQNEIANIGKIDSTLILNVGKAALNAGKKDEALKYFQMLADADIYGTGGKAEESYRVPYQWLTLHYKDAGDSVNMIKYAEKGIKFFPGDDYYNFVLMDYYRENKNMPSLLKIYDKLVSNNPDSLNYHFNYANDIFGYIYNSDEGVVIQDKDNLLQTLHAELDKAMALDPNHVNTNWLYAQYHYNNGIELRDEANKIRSTKPEDVKKKAEMNEAAKASFNKAIPLAEKAISLLEDKSLKKDKSRYKSIVNLMQNIYQSLSDKTNLKAYQDKYDNADTKMVNE